MREDPERQLSDDLQYEAGNMRLHVRVEFVAAYGFGTAHTQC